MSTAGVGVGARTGTALCDSPFGHPGLCVAPGRPGWSLDIRTSSIVCEVEDEGDQEQRGPGLARFTPYRHSWTGVPNRGLIIEAAPQICKGNPLHKAMTSGLSDINQKYCLLFKTQVLSSLGFSLFYLEHFAWARLQHQISQNNCHS